MRLVHPMDAPEWREVDERSGDGLVVRLEWSSTEDETRVIVRDMSTGETFAVPVRDGQQARDVFAHPFRYML